MPRYGLSPPLPNGGGETSGRRMGAMRGTEGVIHEEIAERRPRGSEILIVCGFSRKKARVLQNRDDTVREVRNRRSGLLPVREGDEAHGALE